MVFSHSSALPDERTLALDCEVFLGPSGPLPAPGVTNLRFSDLTPEFIASFNPCHIILPLFFEAQDAMTVIECLEELGYTGRITVLAPPLPKPNVVERELRSAGPGTRLTLISP